MKRQNKLFIHLFCLYFIVTINFFYMFMLNYAFSILIFAYVTKRLACEQVPLYIYTCVRYLRHEETEQVANIKYFFSIFMLIML